MLLSIKIPRNSAFLGLVRVLSLFFLLEDIEILLTFMSKKKFMLSQVQHFSFITSGSGLYMFRVHSAIIMYADL